MLCAGGEELERAGAAGTLGSPLLPHDMALVQLRPLRPFALGELCAFPMEAANPELQHSPSGMLL